MCVRRVCGVGSTRCGSGTKWAERPEERRCGRMFPSQETHAVRESTSEDRRESGKSGRRQGGEKKEVGGYWRSRGQSEGSGERRDARQE
ncbi:hypothetical protein BD414DRAFT_502603 [Trametes punicea]|nr:hypothetical protein BD414DRAFT_502603 [Trametes punicea]